jgi:hypothetical protein
MVRVLGEDQRGGPLNPHLSPKSCRWDCGTCR